MDENSLRIALADLPLGPLRFYAKTGSTNSEAAHWAEAGAPDLAIVVADEQIEGRGRSGRKWYTHPGAALAFSLVFREKNFSGQNGILSIHYQPTLTRLTMLGALAINQALQLDYAVKTEIKWPNDVLLNGSKVAGILVEAQWVGHDLTTVILGIGLNVFPEAVPAPHLLSFPATCLQTALIKMPARTTLLKSILTHLLKWRTRLETADFLKSWERHLAYRGQRVQISQTPGVQDQTVRQGILVGVDQNGGLVLRDATGQLFTVFSGELCLVSG